ncbi:acyl-coenzyme A amino acid N-acyltransferase 1-like isoform X2 [Dreissena polymorpha]|nr:acyl-coenzyme A amino acid N-acyltransferase 1-like isoform X2 [Dreissena polymorpha]
MTPLLTVNPKRHLLVDDKLSISISGLKGREKITVHAHMEEDDKKFESFGWFEVGYDGQVDLTKSASCGGTYEGVSSMGLFWSMVPCPGQMDGIRLMKKNIETPFKTVLSVHEGYQSLDQLRESAGEILCSTEIERFYKAQAVKKVEVTDGRLRGMLYLPPGPGPYPGVIDLFGTVGGIVEFRSALLASRGIASFALPYFRYKDLPASLDEIDLDYFMEAIDYLLKRDDIIQNGVGVVGVSKGGDIALMMATHNPKVRAVVNINGCTFCASYPMKYSGGDIPEVRLNMEKMELIDGRFATKSTLDYTPDDIFKVWKHDAKVLNILSEDDMCSPKECIRLLHSLYPSKKVHNCIVAAYKGAGHLVEPPYTPLCSYSYHKTFDIFMWWGGKPADHAFAQEDSWWRILELFHEQLGQTISHAKL